MMNMDVRHTNRDTILDYTFQENASTGYVWRLEENTNIKVIRITTKAIDPNLVGGRMEKTFFVQPVGPGEFEIKFIQVRPWEKNSRPLNEYSEKLFVS